MDSQELGPRVAQDRPVTIVIVAQSREELDRSIERYFREMHPSKHVIQVDDGPLEKDGTWKVVLKRTRCR